MLMNWPGKSTKIRSPACTIGQALRIDPDRFGSADQKRVKNSSLECTVEHGQLSDRPQSFQKGTADRTNLPGYP
jgi:hypothetical protein